MNAKARLERELVKLNTQPIPLIRAKPKENDILQFHYVLEGPPGTPFAGGYYHGILRFPPQYPLKPPSVMMYTPSGRFSPGSRICLSMSDFHPETWNPVWGVSSILLGLQSFMLEDSPAVGTVEGTAAARRTMAAQSLAYNVEHSKEFCSLFPELVELHEQRKKEAAKAASEAAQLATASGGASASSTVSPVPVPPAPAKGAGFLSKTSIILILVVLLLAWLFAK